MTSIATQYRSTRAQLAALLFSAWATAAHAVDFYNGTTLRIPELSIGSQTFTNVVVTPGTILGAHGGPPAGSVDSYDPSTGQLTIPAVTYGSTTYTNVSSRVQGLVSIAGANGIDGFDGSALTIPAVQVLGGPVYHDVVVTVGNSVSLGLGMPTVARDTYNPSTRQLTIPAVRYLGKVYTNVTATVATIVTAGGTRLFTDNTGLWSLNQASGQLTHVAAATGNQGGIAQQAGALAMASGKAYFAGGDAINPLGLYVSDGTAAGTSLVRAFAAGAFPSTLAGFTPLSNGAALFIYDAGNGTQSLWTVKGSAATAVTVAGTGTPYTNDSGVFPAINLGPGQSGELGANLLFTDTTGLWSLNETTGQVTLLAKLAIDVGGVARQAGSLAVTGGKAYFAAGDAHNPLGLYASDGTAGGTALVRTFAAGAFPATLAGFTPLANGAALFVYDAGDGTQSLWTINGSTVAAVTVAGTGIPYSNASGVFPAINLGPGQSGEIAGNLLFTDTSGLWSLNESTGQVRLVTSFAGDVNGVAQQAGSLAVTGGKAYFAAGDANNPLGLYASDGTAGGTTLVRTFAAGAFPSTLAGFTPLANGSALFVYDAGDGTQSLWTINGSTVAAVTLAAGGATYSNTSGAFPSINLGPGQSGAP